MSKFVIINPDNNLVWSGHLHTLVGELSGEYGTYPTREKAESAIMRAKKSGLWMAIHENELPHYKADYVGAES